MPVSQVGQLNTTALAVPDLYIQIVPPQNQLINGVPTNVLGIVGTATWGPVNSPTTVGNINQYAAIFGPVQNRKYDLGTPVAIAGMQGANNFKIVRVTDGTDTAASVAIGTTGVTVTSKYTGTFGNGLVTTLSAGSQANSWRVVVSAPGIVPETFDNVGAGLTANALWVAIAAAINNGTSTQRGPSKLIVATAGASTSTPTAGSSTLSGGTDGATTLTASVLLGQDTVPRKGMYALRNTGASVAMLSDLDDSTSWATQVAFGLSEGIYMIGTGPSGDSISNAVTTKGTAGIDSYDFKLLFGDWVYWLDTYNNILRLCSPQAFSAGWLANAAPNQSTLNKPFQGVVGTQKSFANQLYSSADLQQLAGAGIDLIANPIPRGKVFGARFGRNSSSNATIRGDNYPRMTNYIAYTLDAGMGIFVGELQTQKDSTIRLDAKATLDHFLQGLIDQKLIDDFSVICDETNNSPSRIALGYMQADVKVRYQSVIEYFLINLEGGQSVQIARQSTQAA